MDFRYSMVIGDWSNDGHGKCETYIFRCTHNKSDILKAYKKAVKTCGVAVHEEGMNQKFSSVLSVYEDSRIRNPELKKLRELGCKFEWRENEFEIEDEDEGEELYCGPHDVFCLFLEMVQTQLPDFRYEEEKKPESINGWWDKLFNEQLGYGVF